MRLFNTLTRSVEEFRPADPACITFYSCGPTVYRYVHVGNLRTYLMADWLKRSLRAFGYGVQHVVNITDVGHMRAELLDRGEDKVVAEARKAGKSAGEIAAFYTEAFHRDLDLLRIERADRYPRATDHVPEMIAITERLLEHGHAYEVDGTIYFAVDSFPGYGRLSGNLGEALLEAVRADADPNKRDPRDFALWKQAEAGREVRWPSPWGDGFPGWHIECSAMSTKYLGETIDLHSGGVDNIFPHHEDEIAQCEAAFGAPFVRHWVHAQHLLVDGLKMAKSTGNAYTLDDLLRRGFDPLAFRYLCLGTHYRSRLNFTFTALRAAAAGLERLRRHAAVEPAEPSPAAGPYRARFREALADDLAMPRALGIAWDVSRAKDLSPGQRSALLRDIDLVLGLDLARAIPPVPRELESLAAERASARARGEYARADALRGAIREAGYTIGDGAGTTMLARVPAATMDSGLVTSSDDVPDHSADPSTSDFSFVLVAQDNAGDLSRAIASIERHVSRPYELVITENGTPGVAADALRVANGVTPAIVVAADHNLGAAAARNAALRAATGEHIVMLDASIELTGDAVTALEELLADPAVGVAGPFGLHTHDWRRFEEQTSGDVDAMQAYLFAFRRELLPRVGWLDEKFRFYRNMDIEYSLRFRAQGLRVVAAQLPLVRHDHREWTALAEDERERRSKKNFYRFHHRWGHRKDLLLHTQH